MLQIHKIRQNVKACDHVIVGYGESAERSDNTNYKWPSTSSGLKILGEKNASVLNIYRLFSCHYAFKK